MKAEKLPSGNWRVQIYLGKDEKGKNIRRSATAKTKQEALLKAATYKPSTLDGAMTVQEACEEFLRIRGPELSPATVRGYKGTLEAHIKGHKIATFQAGRLTTPIVQEWVSQMASSSKTKKNHLGFLVAVIHFFDPDKSFRVKIRETEKKELYTPTLEEVNKVLKILDPETRLAAMLGVFGMRRGEICALEADDLDRKKNLVRINKALAKSDTGEWVVKLPKTKSSIRWVNIPAGLMVQLPQEGRLISCSPDCITNRFAKAVEKAGVPRFRFHDLRSFFASVAVTSLGISERTVQDLGGWKTNNVLRRHYERSMTDQKRADVNTILDYFTAGLGLAE